MKNSRMTSRQAKAIFIANFDSLPEKVKQAVEFKISNWRELNIEEAKFFLSDFGRLSRSPQEFDKEIRQKNFKRGVPKIFHVAQDKDGYEIVNISVNGHSRNVGVHVLVAEAFIDNPEDKTQVNHYNGVKFDNYIWNIDSLNKVQTIKDQNLR